MKDNILVWTKDLKNSGTEIFVFDSEMRLLKKVRQDNFDKALDLKLFTSGDHFVLCSKQIDKDYVVFKATLFDEMASAKSEVILDNIKTYSANKLLFDFLQSPDKKTICFVKATSDAPKNILRIDCSFTDGNNIIKKLFGLPFNPYVDAISNMSIDEDQNIYFLKTRNEINRCVLQIYKSVHDKEIMVWA